MITRFKLMFYKALSEWALSLASIAAGRIELICDEREANEN